MAQANVERGRGKAVYRRRAKAECVNADLRNRGIQRVLLRGRDKVRTVPLWFGVAHNLVRAVALRAAAAKAAARSVSGACPTTA
jgi:uncharacterized protein YbjT (DUF2867 family)